MKLIGVGPDKREWLSRRLSRVGLDLGAYRDAPPGLRIWCGSTVETADVKALMPWIEWAFQQELSAQG